MTTLKLHQINERASELVAQLMPAQNALQASMEALRKTPEWAAIEASRAQVEAMTSELQACLQLIRAKNEVKQARKRLKL